MHAALVIALAVVPSAHEQSSIANLMGDPIPRRNGFLSKDRTIRTMATWLLPLVSESVGQTANMADDDSIGLRHKSIPSPTSSVLLRLYVGRFDDCGPFVDLCLEVRRKLSARLEIGIHRSRRDHFYEIGTLHDLADGILKALGDVGG